MMSASTLDPNRRIIVGVTGDGRSTVAADARDIAEAQPVPGYRVQEVWNQPSLPAEVHDEGVTTDAIDIEPPREGALVRVLTIEPLSRDKWVPNPHGDSNRHVLTLVSGTIDLVLEDTEVTMTPGDSVVLSGHVHDWRNCHGVPAVLVYTTFPLRPGDSPAVGSRPMPTAFGE
jgi:mannose-6-phosphate isomerase-like protein (cupin superfamily)